MAEPKLLPCPFCGASSHANVQPYSVVPGRWWVECLVCPCAGPTAKTVGDAKAAWNTRAEARETEE